jgi:hypothetical protein
VRWWGRLRKRDDFVDLDVDGRIIIRRMIWQALINLAHDMDK